MRTALTVAGSDSGGGAGIQADLKSFAAVGVHGTSVITCVTAQNTRTVASIFPLPVAEIRAQLAAVLDDFDIRGAKTGMLYSAEIVRAVADGLGSADFPLVVDPVMVATVGARLERDDFRDALVEHLLPRAALVTPNRHEAQRLAGMAVNRVEDMEAAAKVLRGLGPQAVLVKGGHVGGDLVDVFYDGRAMRRLRGFRYDKELHGAGCTLAASIAAYLAEGQPMLKAIGGARRRVASGFLSSYRAGRGVEIINSQFHPDRYEVWLAAAEAWPRLARLVPRSLVPRGGLELAFALPGAALPGDVCAVRNIARGGAMGTPFGASRQMAAAVLKAMIVHPGARAAAKLKRPTKNVGRLRSAGLTVAAAGAGRRTPADRRGVVPDVVLGGAEKGYEASMVVHGRDPKDVIRKVRRIARAVTA